MTFCTTYSKSSYSISMGVAIILNGGEGVGHTKVDCHANYANFDMLAVLIPFQIFILCTGQGFSKMEWNFYQEKPAM